MAKAEPEQTEQAERVCVQIPVRTHDIVGGLSWRTKASMGSIIARAVDVYLRHRESKGQWVPDKRDLER